MVESRFDVKGKGRAVDAVEGVEGSALLVSGEGGPRVVYRTFLDEEKDLQDIMRLCDQELSEPWVSSFAQVSVDNSYNCGLV